MKNKMNMHTTNKINDTITINADKSTGNAFSNLYDWVEAFIFSIAVVVIVFSFIFRVVRVDGSSMIPTLHHEDRVVISGMFYTPQPEDIIVITKPGIHPQNDEPIIKRIIAVAGQKIDIDFDKGVVLIDGKELVEPYVADIIKRKISGSPIKFPAIVPEGHVFVLGDNRNDSTDSRVIGFISVDQILGKAMLRVYPFDRIGGFGNK